MPAYETPVAMASALKKAELVAMCKKAQVCVTGTKILLAERLMDLDINCDCEEDCEGIEWSDDETTGTEDWGKEGEDWEWVYYYE